MNLDMLSQRVLVPELPEAGPAPRITADELIALSTPDRVKYLRLNRDPNGQLVLTNVDGFDVLSKERREELGVKLVSAAKILHKEDTGAVDADQLAALLGKVQQDQSEQRGEENKREPSPSRTRATASPVPLSEEQGAWYDQLVKEGGRPLFLRDQIEDISSNPERYHSLLRPWAADPDLPCPGEDWQVFSKQVESWHEFRRWQRDNRVRFDEDKELAIYHEEWDIKVNIRGGFSDTSETKHREQTHSSWLETDRHVRAWKHKYDWETSGSRTFLGYAEAAKQRLERHGFVRPFQLQEDAKLQDAWTTWVEYIEYHCWRLDTDLASVGRLQAEYDAAWKKLQDTGVLRDGETAESVSTGEASWERLMEAARAAEARNHLLKLAGPGLDARGSEPAKSTHIQRAEATVEELDKRRNIINGFCDQTKPYRKKTTRIRHLQVLIPFLIEVSSEIWDEEEAKRGLAAPAEASEAAPTSTEGQKKRARSGSADPGLEPPPALKETKRKRGSVAPSTTNSSQTRQGHSADQSQLDERGEQASTTPSRDRGAWMTSLRKRPPRGEGGQETRQPYPPPKAKETPKTRQPATQTRGSTTDGDGAGTREPKTATGPRQSSKTGRKPRVKKGRR